MAASRKPLITRLKKLFNHSNGTEGPKQRPQTKASPETSSTELPNSRDRKDVTSSTNRGQQPSIAIIGAGIGGLALAIALSKRSVPCIVYDAGETFSTVGAGIGLGSNSLDALDLIDPRLRDLYDFAKTGNEHADFRHSVFDALYAEPGLGLSRNPPWVRGLVDAPRFERSSAHRKDLLNMLESFVPPGTVRFSKRLAHIEQQNGKVRTTFEDGETVVTDAVIGCDGINGPTRTAVLGDIAPEAVSPEYCNMYMYRGIMDMADVKAILGEHGGDSKRFMSRRRGVAIYPIARGCEANMKFYVRDDRPWTHGNHTIQCTREEMEKDFQGFDGRLTRLLEWVEPLQWPVFHHRTTPTYFRGRVCMLGDVAHAATPDLAAGAGQSLEDAVVLAHLLSLVRRPDQLEAAFQAYDEVRRPRATRVVEDSYASGLLYCFDGPEGDNMEKIIGRAKRMFRSIWEYDLEADARKAEENFLQLV